MTWITRDQAAIKLGCKPNTVCQIVRRSPVPIRFRDNDRKKPTDYWQPDIDALVEHRRLNPPRSTGRKQPVKTEQNDTGLVSIMNRPWTQKGLAVLQEGV